MRFEAAAFCLAFTVNFHLAAAIAQNQQANTQKGLLLDEYMPAPQLAARADSLQNLIAVTHPTLMWNSDWFWMEPNVMGGFAFSIGSPQRVRHAGGTLFWALLRQQRSGEIERDRDGVVSSEIEDRTVRDLQAVNEKPFTDSGCGDYARVLHQEGNAKLYELGIQYDSLGTGHDIIQRRLYVLRQADSRWLLIGEGPSECSDKSGTESEEFTSDATGKLTGNPKTPAAIEFDTTQWDGMAVESAQPAYPDLEVHREALLDGAGSARFRWLSDAYMLADTHDTLDKIADRYIYWRIYGADQRMANFDGMEAASFKELLRRRNPSLEMGELLPHTKVYVSIH